MFRKLGLSLLAGCALSLIACGDSNSSSASGDYCKVSKTSSTVLVDASYMGQSYSSLATLRGDTLITFHSVYGYPTQQEADEACADEKDEAASWLDGSYKVTCSGKQVIVDDYSEFFAGAAEGLLEVEEDFNGICAKLQSMMD